MAAQGDLTRVFPNGAWQGAKLKLTFGGEKIPDTATLLVDGEGIRPLGPFAKGVGEVEIAPDAKPGVRRLWLAGGKAVTTPRPFAVGTLPELDEKEPNSTPTQAQRLDALPVTVNGTLPTRGEIDVFRVALKKGQTLVVAGEARSLGAPTNLLTRVRDAAGQELAIQMDYRTRDALLGFTAPAEGDYLVELQEVMNNYSNLSDDYVYRVTFTTGPWLDYAFPPGAQRGTSARLAFHGWNLPGGAKPAGETSPALMVENLAEEALESEVRVPADAPERFAVSVGGAPNSVLLATGSAPEQVEREPNGRGEAQAVPVPVTVSGAFRERGDLDVYRFQAKASQTLQIQVEAREIGSLADVTLTLLDAQFKALLTADDGSGEGGGRRRGGGGSRDPSVLWTAPADGEYRVVLRDIAGTSRGGPTFFYRLTIAPPEPELKLTTANPNLTLKKGEKLEVPITVAQSYQPGAVTLRVEGLPKGVTAEPVTVPASPGKTSRADTKVVLVSTAESAPGAALLRVVASVEGNSALTTAASASWVLSKDRSGNLVSGSTDRLLLLIPEP